MPDCHLDWAGGGRRQSTLLSQSEPRQLRRAVNSSSTSIHATKPEKSIRTHFSERVDPEKTHVPVDLSRKEDGMADTSLAGNRGRINKTDGRRRRIRHREPSPSAHQRPSDPAIHHDRNRCPHGIRNRRQHADGRDHSIELPATVGWKRQCYQRHCYGRCRRPPWP